MTEDQLLTLVLVECQKIGLLVFHSTDSRRDIGRGYVDLTITGPRGVMFRELKAASGTLDSDQKVWGYRLRASGADWAIWRPVDWEDGTIRAQLERLAT